MIALAITLVLALSLADRQQSGSTRLTHAISEEPFICANDLETNRLLPLGEADFGTLLPGTNEHPQTGQSYAQPTYSTHPVLSSEGTHVAIEYEDHQLLATGPERNASLPLHSVLVPNTHIRTRFATLRLGHRMSTALRSMPSTENVFCASTRRILRSDTCFCLASVGFYIYGVAWVFHSENLAPGNDLSQLLYLYVPGLLYILYSVWVVHWSVERPEAHRVPRRLSETQTSAIRRASRLFARGVLAHPDTLACTICMDPIDIGVSLPCGHAFHRHCMLRWTERPGGSTCPICRDEYALDTV